MKFYEFGNENGSTIMLLPGNMMTHRQFEDIAPLLARNYRVVTVSFDGFDETGTTTYSTAEEQAKKLAAYIKNNLGGRVNLVLSESLGGAPAAYLTREKDIEIENLIIDGASYWNLGIFNPLAKATLYKIPYAIVSGAKKKGQLKMPSWLLKSMGLTQAEIDAMTHQMCLDVSAETLKNTFIEGIDLYPRMDNWEPRRDIRIACWYGEKEANMKKAIKSLRKAFPNLEVQCFSGLGHGGLAGNPERFVDAVLKFMEG